MGWIIKNGVKRRWRFRMIRRAIDICERQGYIYKTELINGIFTHIFMKGKENHDQL